MNAGYSGTPLAKKLGMKEGMAIAVVDAPDSFIETLGISMIDLDSNKLRKVPTALCGREDIVHLFTNTREGLFRGLVDAKKLIKQNGMIWVSWYKKAAKLPTEITEDTVREAALPLGLVDVKVCAVDEKWSGLKLVIRRENRI